METIETILIRGNRQTALLWCGQCGMKTEMLTIEEAAVAMGVNPRSVYRLIEAGKVHYCEPEKGILRVCLPSLSLLSDQQVEAQDS